MNKKRLIILLGSSLLIAGIVYAQAPFGNGESEMPASTKPTAKELSMARAIYHDMSLTEREGVCAMDFTIRTVGQTYDTFDTAVSMVRYLAGKDRVHYRSEQISFFQDRSVAVAVIPAQKTVFLSSSSMEAIRKKQRDVFALLQDSLFNNCTLLSNEGISEKGSNRRLLLAAGEGMRSRHRIDRVRLDMNTDTKSIQEIAVDFLNGSDLHSVMMKYDRVEWLESTPEFDSPILDIVFASSGVLLPEYQGYRVIDKRGEARRDR